VNETDFADMTETPQSDLPPIAAGPKPSAELDVLSTIVRHLQSLSADAQQRVIASALTFLGLPVNSQNSLVALMPQPGGQTAVAPTGRFSQDRTPSPKDFLFEKRPTSDVERVACLGYYLTHYRDTPYFKTLDLSKLNTEGAQLKMTNPAMAVDNATKAGLLVPASKGAKQISSMGELYVQALPDKAAAREAIAHARPKRKNRRPGKPTPIKTETSTREG
jgi:hypothetical protein